jgi:hypothetical protein
VPTELARVLDPSSEGIDFPPAGATLRPLSWELFGPDQHPPLLKGRRGEVMTVVRQGESGELIIGTHDLEADAIGYSLLDKSADSCNCRFALCNHYSFQSVIDNPVEEVVVEVPVLGPRGFRIPQQPVPLEREI